MQDDAVEGHACLLRFTTDDPQFALGFEVGRLWSVLRERCDEEVTEYAHVANAEMIMRIGDATGRSVSSEELTSTWLLATFAPAE